VFDTILYLRLERATTNSFVTYKLTRPMNFTQAAYMVETVQMPGWEVIFGSLVNPDEPEVS
jgi:hypothetical protein